MFTVAVTCALILVTHMSSRFYVVNVVYVLSVNKNPDRKKKNSLDISEALSYSVKQWLPLHSLF